MTQEQLRALYTGPWADFVARRTALARQMRADGDKDGAREVAALRKPTAAAWAMNLLTVDGRSEPAIVELGEQIAATVGSGDRGELRKLAAAQKLLVTDVLERCAELVAAGGGTLAPAARESVEAVVRSVVTDPSTARTVFTGVLAQIPSDEDEDDALPMLALVLGSSAPRAATRGPADPRAPRKPPTPRTPTRHGTAPSGPAGSADTDNAAQSLAVSRAEAARVRSERRTALRAARTAVQSHARTLRSSAALVAELEEEQTRVRAEAKKIEKSLAGARAQYRRAEQQAEQARRAVEQLED